MSILDNPTKRLALDSHKVGESIALLPNQLTQVLDDIKKQPKLKLSRPINKIVVNGMGGSNLGARLIASILAEKLPLPLLIEPGYTVPGYVDRETLYIISSYSGTTEEPLSVIPELKKRHCQIATITADSPNNPLAHLARHNNWPAYIFDPRYNPCEQPRLGLGYATFGLLELLHQLQLYPWDIKIARQLVKELTKLNETWLPEKPTNKNKAKELATKLYGRQIWLVGPDCLNGNLHILRNQLNETAKNLANYLTVPELNHYAMEGLSFPTNLPETIIILSFKIKGLSERLEQRLYLTDKIFKQNKLPVLTYEAKSSSHLGAALEILAFGSWLSYYLGLLNGVDPAKIPWVDLFKKELA